MARPNKPVTKPQATGHHTRIKSEAQEFAALFVDSKDYRDSLLRRIQADDLAPAVETLLLAYRYGKPVERTEMTFPQGVADYSGMSSEEMAARAEELAREVREAQALLAETEKASSTSGSAGAGPDDTIPSGVN